MFGVPAVPVAIFLDQNGPAARIRGSEPPSLRRERAALTETLRCRVLALAADGLNEIADVAEPGEAPAVDGLVYLTEARGLGGFSAGRAGEADHGKSGDGSRDENALHVTSLPLVGAGSPIEGDPSR
jgi:hypothetical protein